MVQINDFTSFKRTTHVDLLLNPLAYELFDLLGAVDESSGCSEVGAEVVGVEVALGGMMNRSLLWRGN